MTLTNIKTAILAHLSDKESFGIENFSVIPLDKSFDSHRTDLIHSALNSLVEDKIIVKINDNLWILNGDPSTIMIPMEISLYTSLAVTQTIETFLKAGKVKHDPIDPTTIGEPDVQMLLRIINQILETQE